MSDSPRGLISNMITECLRLYFVCPAREWSDANSFDFSFIFFPRVQEEPMLHYKPTFHDFDYEPNCSTYAVHQLFVVFKKLFVVFEKCRWMNERSVSL